MVGAVLAQHVDVDRYAEIDHRPAPAEIDDAVAAARHADWRLGTILTYSQREVADPH